MSGVLQDVVRPTIGAVLKVGVPVSLGFLAWQMLPQYADLSAEEQSSVIAEREAINVAVASATVGVLGVASLALWLARGR